MCPGQPYNPERTELGEKMTKTNIVMMGVIVRTSVTGNTDRLIRPASVTYEPTWSQSGT